jgi:hypothetical protein
MAEVTNRPSLTLQVESVLIGFGANRHTYSMNMLASPGGMRAALILAITCSTRFHIRKNHTRQFRDSLAQPFASKYPRL